MLREQEVPIVVVVAVLTSIGKKCDPEIVPVPFISTTTEPENVPPAVKLPATYTRPTPDHVLVPFGVIKLPVRYTLVGTDKAPNACIVKLLIVWPPKFNIVPVKVIVDPVAEIVPSVRTNDPVTPTDPVIVLVNPGELIVKLLMYPVPLQVPAPVNTNGVVPDCCPNTLQLPVTRTVLPFIVTFEPPLDQEET